MTIHNITNISFLDFLSKNISVIGAILGSLMAGIISYLIQSNNNKSKLKESKQQLLFKIIEQDLKEKRELIKPLLQFYESIVHPANISFPDDIDEFNTSGVLQQYQIKKHMSEFMIDYSIFMNNEVKGAIWQLHDSLLQIEKMDAMLSNSDLSAYDNAYNIAVHASASVERVRHDISELTTILYKEIAIDKS